MGDTEVSSSGEWTMLNSEKLAPGDNRSEVGNSECSLSDKDSCVDDGETSSVDKSPKEETATQMPIDFYIAQDEDASHLKIPLHYSRLDRELETEESGGILAVQIRGGVKAGKTSLAKAIVQCLLPRNWAISEEDDETEFVQLQRDDSPNVMRLYSGNSQTHVNVKNLNICIFALPPHYTDDMLFYQMEKVVAENDFDMVLPVICKVDSMNTEELASYRETLRENMPKKPNISSKEIFGVVCNDRKYSWGSVSPLSEISQLKALCTTLEGHLQLESTVSKTDLVEVPGAEADGQKDTESCRSSRNFCSWLLSLFIVAMCLLVLSDISIPDPTAAKNSYGFELFLFVLVLAPLGPQKELTILLAIACALFWRVAEDRRQKEVQDISLSFEELVSANEYSLAQLNSCNGLFQECTQRVQNISLRLHDTSERLALALELCGSWCLEV